jgi:uncharacterized protein DUF5684
MQVKLPDYFGVRRLGAAFRGRGLPRPAGSKLPASERRQAAALQNCYHRSNQSKTICAQAIGGDSSMSNILAFLMQSDDTAGNAAAAGMGIGMMIVWLAIIVLMIAALWKVFEKAGEPGWAAIIPIYNLYIMLKIAGRPGWWLLLYFIPFVNFIISIIVSIDIAKRFGKSTGFALGLVFLPFIFYPMLAWGDASYTAAPAMA